MMKSIVIAGLFLSSLAMADHHEGMHKGHHKKGNGPCREDMEKFCSEAGDEKGAKMKCMMEHKEELSAECKEMHSKAKEALSEVREACKEDVKKLCGDVESGEGRIMKCLREKRAELSDACKSEMKEKKEMRKKKKKDD